jgi:hypothetical protein
MVQFGTGFLTLDVINSANPPTWLLYLCAIVSMGLAATIGFAVLKLVPSDPISPTPSSIEGTRDNPIQSKA